MTKRPIQEQFGDTIIEAIRQFARADMEPVAVLEVKLFGHIGDLFRRRVLAETLYGARWIYKLGLALLVRDEEQMAHVRAQVLDYGSICENLLLDMILRALKKGIMTGTKYKFSDTRRLRNPINWTTGVEYNLGRQTYYWHIAVAADETIIDQPLAAKLHALRKERNTVHLMSRTYKAFLGTSMKSYQTLMDTVNQTRIWSRAHP